MHTLEQLNALRAQLAASGDGALRHQVAELETRAAVAQRTVQSQRALLASHRQNAQQLQQQVQDKIAQQAQLQATLAQLAQEMETQQRALAETAQQESSLTERAAPLRQELVELQRQQREGERERAQSLERLNEAELEYSRLVLERDRLKEEQSSLAREIEAELGPIDLPSEVSHQLRLELGDDIVELPTVDALPQGLGDEIRQLKMRLRRLGAINPDAPKEYEQLLERQTFLQTQAADLRGCIASLHEVIQELDALIEQDFVRTVKTVDEAFARYFRLLFNGGTAHLVLTDPQNPSATGVDIVAHPPGKKAQNLALLSGGERALTAVALLFALLQANPVPFCFLDEVDAALDEANVSRFRDLLREHAKTTQFIVITHNRHTIEAASTLYGISMGEQGVSQCISLQLGNGNQVAQLVEETQG